MVSTSLPFRFGICEFTSWPWSFEQDVDNYVRLGADTIEVCESKLDDERAAEQLALIGERGLTISSVQPAVRTLYPSQTQPEPKDPHERTEQFRQTIERFSSFAEEGAPFVCNTGPPPNGNIQEVFDVAAREYRGLADVAQAHGVRVALEPLSPALMNVESAIWTLPQAMRIVAAVDHANFGICVDFWNVWGSADIVEEIKACGDRIFVVHISDWRTPRSFADRHIVGQGEIPLPALIRAVDESGYRDAYTLEILSSDVPNPLWEADLSEVIRESRSGLEKAWREAFESS
jgi:sugar phosphate isomerase/epimerase